MLHYLSRLHQQTYSFYRDAALTDKLATIGAVFFACGVEGVG